MDSISFQPGQQHSMVHVSNFDINQPHLVPVIYFVPYTDRLSLQPDNLTVSIRLFSVDTVNWTFLHFNAVQLLTQTTSASS